MATCVLTEEPLIQWNYTLNDEDAWAAQLASQHHLSDYNRLKFGHLGSNFTYVPLSIHMPQYYIDLQERQTICLQQKSWWPSPKPTCQPSVILGPCGTQTEPSPEIQREISAAIASPLSEALEKAPAATLHSHIKTSSSHPINISTIIPPEFLPLISSSVQVNLPGTSATICHLPPIHTLDNLITQAMYRPSVSSPPILLRIPPSALIALPPTSTPSSTSSQVRKSISDALLSAITNNGTSESKSFSKGMLWGNSRPSSPIPFDAKTGTNTPIPFKSGSNTPMSGSFLSERSKSLPVPTPSPPPFLLGNLFLSSCPGKKVRLTGPVKGRSGVCRDLATDLARMRDLRVGCIVCCLDDTELEFLGAPWPEYVAAAQEIGIDVLRIPTPEGLAPITPSSLDAHLTRLIRSYTIKGINILVHCRGGVGRAGVVACCWALRLGLCGNISLRPTSPLLRSTSSLPATFPLLSSSHSSINTTASDPTLPQKTEEMRLVETVIAVIRKRRSIKAIETFEQVQFLVDFIRYMKAGGELAGTNGQSSSFEDETDGSCSSLELSSIALDSDISINSHGSGDVPSSA